MARRMRMDRVLLAVCAMALSACGSASPTASDPTSTTTAPTRTTETFPGMLAQGGAVYHLFNVQQQGQVDITLTKTEPLATIILGLGIAQTSGGQCIPVLLAYNNAAQAGTVMSGTAGVGSYCAVVYDLGNVADPVTYTLTVTHP
jgi:hypothetical protein